MMAGTSTGSIIAAGLSYPKDGYPDESDAWSYNEYIPKYWGKDIIEVYSLKGDFIFTKSEGIDTAIQVILIIVYILVFASIGFYLGRMWYDHPD